MTTKPPLAFSIADVVARTPFSDSFIRQQIRAGKLRAKLLKGRRGYVITPAAFDDWFDSLPDAA